MVLVESIRQFLEEFTVYNDDGEPIASVLVQRSGFQQFDVPNEVCS